MGTSFISLSTVSTGLLSTFSADSKILYNIVVEDIIDQFRNAY